MVMGNPADGPVAPPGTYRIRLDAGDWSDTKAFDIRKDPRPDVTDSDLREMFDFTMEVRNMISETQKAVRDLRSIREQAQSLSSSAVDAGYNGGIQSSADQLVNEATSLEDEIINNDIESGQDAIGMKRVFTNNVARLYQATQGEHDKPTDGMKERMSDLKNKYNNIINKYDNIMQKELNRFNSILKSKEIEHVKVNQ